MRRPPLHTGSRRRDSGFALLIVLWTLVLIAFLVLHLTATGRTEIRIADNLVANAVAAAAADGAVSEAIFNLSNPRPEQRWPVGGSPPSVDGRRLPGRRAARDEAARVNPNLASPALMEALLRVLGSDPGSARQIADAIADWVGSSATPRPPTCSRPPIAPPAATTRRPARRLKPSTSSAGCWA